MPEATVVNQVFLPLSLAFIMFSLGLALTVADFKRVAVQPKDFVIGAACQMVALPALAVALLAIWPMDPALAVGVMILAACPGGITSNLLTHLARGDTALSVSLNAVISAAAVVTLPLIVGLSIRVLMGQDAPQISILGTIVGVFLIMLVPIAIGMAVKRWAPDFADRFERVARHISTVLFILIVAAVAYNERGNLADYFRQTGPPMLILNLATMGVAFAAANLFRLGRRQRTAIVLECGLQNGSLAIVVAGTLIGNTVMMIAAGIYSLIMFLSGGLFVIVTARRERLAQAAPAVAR
jgi:BASS family bile acid:Na+ symporter